MQTTHEQTEPQQTRLPYTRQQQLGEACALLAVGGLSILQVQRVLATTADVHAVHLVLVLLGALSFADLLSGLVHWFADTWGSERTPWLGAWIIRSFRDHHDDPAGITRHGFVETNGATAAGLLPVQGLTLLACEGSTLLFITLSSLLLLLTNQIHAWAHAPSAARPRAVRWLQDRGVILSASHHAAHHVRPFVARYCITTGWCNAALDAVGFWRGFERAITATTGAQPRMHP